MRCVKSRDTAPEMAVRDLVCGLGFRYRLHRDDLPGKPDLVFGKQRRVIFVHGCFWHGHRCKRGDRAPETNAEYWRLKISRNRDRDAKVLEDLGKQGWVALVVWECELRNSTQLAERIRVFLSS